MPDPIRQDASCGGIHLLEVSNGLVQLSACEGGRPARTVDRRGRAPDTADGVSEDEDVAIGTSERRPSSRDTSPVGFDIFVQGLKDGDAATRDGEAALAVLDPHISLREDTWARIRTGDGEVDVFGIATAAKGLMFSRPQGQQAMDLIYEVARRARFVILPTGCGTLLTDKTVRSELPAGVPEPIVHVSSGDDIVAAIRAADHGHEESRRRLQDASAARRSDAPHRRRRARKGVGALVPQGTDGRATV